MSRLNPLRTIALCLLALVVTSACGQLDDLPQLTKADLLAPDLAQTSRIYDRDGNLIRTLHGVEDRTVVRLKRIPKKVQHAVVAIEDERFYEHDGVDLKAILRAAFTNAASGEIEEGGSTITQQYVKNVIIAPGEFAEKTLERKIDEAVLARQLEEKLSKREILERYLNTVYFGSGAYGIQAAARAFFRKPVQKLSLGEAALLAGLIRSPDTYNPYTNKEAAIARRNLVLDKMVEVGWATQAGADAVRSKGLGVKPRKEDTKYPAPYFVDYVQRLIKFDDERFEAIGSNPNARERALFTGGLRIHTTVDLEMQAAADESVNYYLGPDCDRSVLTDPAATRPVCYGPHGSLVAIEPDTGEIRAMTGGLDFFASEKEDPFAKLNLAIQHEPGLGRVKDCGATKYENRAPGCGRQAGSAYKPFALVAALEDGIPLSKTYTAEACMQFAAYDNWNVCNYEKSSYGQKTVLEATAASINTVYAQLAIDAGFEDVVDTAEKMGITIEQDAYASSVLGTNSVNPLNMTSAYGTLAAEGSHTPPVAITKITDSRGRVLYEDESESEQVVEPAVAYVATTALESVITSGTGTNGSLYPRPAAGKTGTAQDYRDAWFGGYTPDLVAAVWVGHPEGQVSMAAEYAGGPVFGGSFPTLIWQRFMTQALAGTEMTPFTEPAETFVTVEIDTEPPPGAPDAGCLAGPFTPEEDREYVPFLKGTEPTTTCRETDEEVTVPDVYLWQSADEAESVLEEAGFVVSRSAESTDDYPPGTVLDQEPDGGEEAPYGSTIELTVATTGSGDGTVPPVLGRSLTAAEDELSSSGYIPDVITERESGGGRSRSGVVWKQDPASGTALSPGGTVTIWVNP
ncbi:MAG: transglycosylase domain-containing protein [Actinomycetota bacterium]|nr:transglycosylase domain-containing protein [Actinomycetota bacterium]